MSDLDRTPVGSARWLRRVANVALAVAVSLAVWIGADALTELPGPPVVPVRDHLVVEVEPTVTPSSTAPPSTAPPTVGPSTSVPPAEVPPEITRQPVPDDDDDGDDDSGGDGSDDGSEGGDDDGGGDG